MPPKKYLTYSQPILGTSMSEDFKLFHSLHIMKVEPGKKNDPPLRRVLKSAADFPFEFTMNLVPLQVHQRSVHYLGIYFTGHHQEPEQQQEQPTGTKKSIGTHIHVTISGGNGQTYERSCSRILSGTKGVDDRMGWNEFISRIELAKLWDTLPMSNMKQILNVKAEIRVFGKTITQPASYMDQIALPHINTSGSIQDGIRASIEGVFNRNRVTPPRALSYGQKQLIEQFERNVAQRDVKLDGKDCVLRVHKFILTSASAVFEARIPRVMAADGGLDSEGRCLYKVPALDFEVLSTLEKHLYTGRAPSVITLDLLKVMNRFQIDSLKRACDDAQSVVALMESIKVTDNCAAFRWADVFNMARLRAASVALFVEHAEGARMTAGWTGLGPELAQELNAAVENPKEALLSLNHEWTVSEMFANPYYEGGIRMPEVGYFQANSLNNEFKFCVLLCPYGSDEQHNREYASIRVQMLADKEFVGSRLEYKVAISNIEVDGVIIIKQDEFDLTLNRNFHHSELRADATTKDTFTVQIMMAIKEFVKYGTSVPIFLAYLETLKSLYTSGKGGDVLLRFGQRQFLAHKQILGVRSVLFGRIFAQSEYINLLTLCPPENNLSDVAVADMLLFIYTGQYPSQRRMLHDEHLKAWARKFQLAVAYVNAPGQALSDQLFAGINPEHLPHDQFEELTKFMVNIP